MDLKSLLLDLGYSENQVNSIINKEKIYFQQDVDNIVEKSKARFEEKRDRDYISKSDYDFLQSEHNNLIKEVKINSIKQSYLANGGNEKYFNDFMKVNEDLLAIDKNINETIIERAKNNDWAFNKNTPTKAPYGYEDKLQKDPFDDFDGETIY